jgi:polyhydroxybutyrate depolymerase
MTTTRETLQVGGQTRSYILSVPDTYDASRSYPLVMVLHGNPGSADAMLAQYPFDVASQGDAILVYPNAANDNWDLYTEPPANVDIPFLQALPAAVAAKVHVDTTRVFGSGFSGGAFFLNQMACIAPGTFKAFASHSGGAPYLPNNPPTWPNGCLKCVGATTPAILVHGLADNEVDPNDSKFAAGCWSTTNACANTDPDTWTATSPTPCTRNKTCGASAAVELCLIDGMHHEQWSQGALTAWGFFQQIP